MKQASGRSKSNTFELLGRLAAAGPPQCETPKQPQATKRTDSKPLAAVPDWESWAGSKGSGGKRAELTKTLATLVQRHKTMIELVQHRGKDMVASGRPGASKLSTS